jgi:hypothetical protein
MKCRITYQGCKHSPAIYIKAADRHEFFSRMDKQISILIEGKVGYTTLKSDFFGSEGVKAVGQIRTIYPSEDKLRSLKRDNNLLVDWIRKNKMIVGDYVEIEVIIPFREFRLKKG